MESFPLIKQLTHIIRQLLMIDENEEETEDFFASSVCQFRLQAHAQLFSDFSFSS
jgi:hypothetical protein